MLIKWLTGTDLGGTRRVGGLLGVAGRLSGTVSPFRAEHSLLHPRQPPCIPHLSLIPVVAEPMHSPPDISCSSPPQPRSPLCEYRRTQLSPQPPTFHTSLLPGPFSTVFTGKQSKWPSTSSLCLSVLPGSSHPPIDPLSQLLCGGQSPRHTP